MARKASIEKNNKRKEISSRYIAYRAELREKAVNMKLSDEERFEARKNFKLFLVIQIQTALSHVV